MTMTMPPPEGWDMQDVLAVRTLLAAGVPVSRIAALCLPMRQTQVQALCNAWGAMPPPGVPDNAPAPDAANGNANANGNAGIASYHDPDGLPAAGGLYWRLTSAGDGYIADLPKGAGRLLVKRGHKGWGGACFMRGVSGKPAWVNAATADACAQMLVATIPDLAQAPALF